MPKIRRKKRTTKITEKATIPTSKTRSTAQNTAVSLTESDKTASSAAVNSSSDPSRSLFALSEDCEAMQLSREFRKLCFQHANPSYAASMRQYVRNQFAFFGIKAPERRRLQKDFTSAHRDRLTCRPFLLQFMICLWQLEERECQLYGVDLASQFRKEILGDTRADYEEAIACAEILLATKSWWDTVDLLASQSEQVYTCTCTCMYKSQVVDDFGSVLRIDVLRKQEYIRHCLNTGIHTKKCLPL